MVRFFGPPCTSSAESQISPYSFTLSAIWEITVLCPKRDTAKRDFRTNVGRPNEPLISQEVAISVDFTKTEMTNSLQMPIIACEPIALWLNQPNFRPTLTRCDAVELIMLIHTTVRSQSCCRSVNNNAIVQCRGSLFKVIALLTGVIGHGTATRKQIEFSQFVIGQLTRK